MSVRSTLRRARRASGSQRRVVWQAASLLLSYPDESLLARLPSIEAALADLPADEAGPLLAMADRLSSRPLIELQAQYVETFDRARRRALFLTYWVAGDTRNRGHAMLRFSQAYRDAGVEPPAGELPDHVPVVLEFAALVDPESGKRLLAEHATPLRMLADALDEYESPYAGVVRTVCQTLPASGPDDLATARRLAMAGPPVEAVGLDPYPMPSTTLPFPTMPSGGTR